MSLSIVLFVLIINCNVKISIFRYENKKKRTPFPGVNDLRGHDLNPCKLKIRPSTENGGFYGPRRVRVFYFFFFRRPGSLIIPKIPDTNPVLSQRP
jgi:hypothetical protein